MTVKNSSVKSLIAKTEKPVISNNILTKSIAQSARNNQPGILGNQRNSKNYSLSPSRQIQVSKKFLPDKVGNKKTLILDLDETLVHSGFKGFKVSSDMVLKIELEAKIHDIHVLIRPGAKEFLERMADLYELVIFTASLSKVSKLKLSLIFFIINSMLIH
jgi:carboxy-terminal domain RNA polymerase II polypeptide A small phosphatase